ncbi:MAG: DUF418 domain-containing protein [Bacteroidota bacterium]
MQTTSSTRLPVIDFLRGCALFGILVVNVWVFSTSFIGYATWTTFFTSPFDELMMGLSALLFEQRFVGVFALVFGVSIAIQQERFAEQEHSFGKYFVKRSLVFMGLGVLNILLFFWGDILLIYGVLSLLFYPLMRLSNKVLLWIAAVIFLIPTLLFLSTPFKLMFHEYEEGIRQYYTPESLTQTYQSGTFTEMSIARVREYLSYNAFNLLWQRTALSCIIVGYVMGRSQLQYNYVLYKKRMLWILVGCVVYAIAFLSYFFLGYNKLLPHELFFSLHALFIPISIFIYVALLLGVYHLRVLQKLVQYIADMGRLSLSNYFFQSVVCCFLFTNAGLSWYYHTTPVSNLLVALGVFILQLLVTQLYLRKFITGPLEVLMRRLTTSVHKGTSMQ